MQSDSIAEPTVRGQSMKPFWLYVLRLERGKYYVGITTKTPEKRMQEHVFGYPGARWTKKYKPIAIHDKKDLGMMTLQEAETYENKVVRKYMHELGYNNTRGGDLTSEERYVSHFGRIFTADNWGSITTVSFLLLAIAALLLDKYSFI